MKAESVEFKGHGCFIEQYAGFETIKPINVVIGRNNAGKSTLLDIVDVMCGRLVERRWQYRLNGTLDEASLKQAFHEGTIGGGLPGDHWKDNGKLLVGLPVEWTMDVPTQTSELISPSIEELGRHGKAYAARRREILKQLVINGPSETNLSARRLRRLKAERNIQPELAKTAILLGDDGSGATNLIRRLLTTTNKRYPQALVKETLVKALDRVYGPDAAYAEIEVRLHDEHVDESLLDHWEVFLREEGKDAVSLSRSGSGLKTVMLVLLNLLVVPVVETDNQPKYVFVFEELENNLHPALLRRLLSFIEQHVVETQSVVFLSTHSSVTIDMFGTSPDAQIVHVTSKGRSSQAVTVKAHLDRLGVIDELGARPSDLLQSNGIVWVEGPSDMIYINRWIELASNGRLKRGRDYQCALYGGALLAHAQVRDPDDADTELVNLLAINPNIVVVCDSDQAYEGAPLKGRVRRIVDQVSKVPSALAWVLAAREIENYIPGEVISEITNCPGCPDPDKYERFYPLQSFDGSSYIERQNVAIPTNKIELAKIAAANMMLDNMKDRLDWFGKIKDVCERIRNWERN